MKKTDYIFHNLRNHSDLKIYTATKVRDNDTEVVIEYTISERYPISDVDKILDLGERLTCGGGRRVYQLEELAHPYNPNRHD